VIALGELLDPTFREVKVIDFGEKETEVRPEPVRFTVWGLVGASSVTVTVAALEPIACGVKLTVMEQFAPTATVEPQLFVCAKSPGLAPVIATLLMFKVAVPLLVRVAVCDALVIAHTWLPKGNEPGDIATPD
jgi:hypothetical protein